MIKKIAVFWLVLIPLGLVSGQDQPTLLKSTSVGLMSSLNKNTKDSGDYYIAEVKFDIQGLTMEYVLRQKADIAMDHRFNNEAELADYLHERQQVLLNERVLESVTVSYELVTSENGQAAIVTYHVKDTWNLIALPYFRFDSNTGLLLSLRGRDYNFLGSMQTLTLDIDYRVTDYGKVGYGIYTAFSYPFFIGPVYSSLSVAEEVSIFPDKSPVRNITKLDFGVSYKWNDSTLNASIYQSLSTNPDGAAFDIDPYILSTGFNINTAVNVVEELLDNGPVVYGPAATLSLSWRPDGPVREDRQGLTITIAQRLSWGRVDWIANMKRGLIFSASNSNSYYSRDSSFIADADLSVSGFATALGRLSVKTKLDAYKRLIGPPRSGVGDVLRGIINNRITADTGVAFNLDFPVKLFDFPAHKIIKYDWLDFELQASPFIDAGCYLPKANSKLDDTALYLSGGLEVLVFPKRMRSFIVRGSAGFDLRHLAEGRRLDEAAIDGYLPYELFFGVGLHY